MSIPIYGKSMVLEVMLRYSSGVISFSHAYSEKNSHGGSYLTMYFK